MNLNNKIDNTTDSRLQDILEQEKYELVNCLEQKLCNQFLNNRKNIENSIKNIYSQTTIKSDFTTEYLNVISNITKISSEELKYLLQDVEKFSTQKQGSYSAIKILNKYYIIIVSNFLFKESLESFYNGVNTLLQSNQKTAHKLLSGIKVTKSFSRIYKNVKHYISCHEYIDTKISILLDYMSYINNFTADTIHYITYINPIHTKNILYSTIPVIANTILYHAKLGYDPASAVTLSVSMMALNYVTNFMLKESKYINNESQTTLLTKYFLLKKIEFHQEVQSSFSNKKIDQPKTNLVLPNYLANNNHTTKLIIKEIISIMSSIVTQTPVLTIGKLLSISNSVQSCYSEQQCEKAVYRENSRIIQNLQLDKFSVKDLELKLQEEEKASKLILTVQKNNPQLNPLIKINHNKKVIEDQILNYKRNVIKKFIDSKNKQI